MPAGVEEGPDLPAPVAQHQDWACADGERNEAADFRQLAGRRGEDPLPVEDRLQVEGVDLGIGAERAVQRMVRLARAQQPAQAVVHGFGTRSFGEAEAHAKVSECVNEGVCRSVIGGVASGAAQAAISSAGRSPARAAATASAMAGAS